MLVDRANYIRNDMGQGKRRRRPFRTDGVLDAREAHRVGFLVLCRGRLSRRRINTTLSLSLSLVLYRLLYSSVSLSPLADSESL